MDSAPLNLAHFHERRADKLIKRHRYNDAYKAIEISLHYIESACKDVKTPQALEVLCTQKWDYERKLNQIEIRRQQYEKMKSKEIVPPVKIEAAPIHLKTDTVNTQSIERCVDRTMMEFKGKCGSTLLGHDQRMDSPQPVNNDTSKLQDLTAKVNGNLEPKEMASKVFETNIKRLSILDNQLHTNDDELPSLVPLELPPFDYT